jgi:uncharacterized protein YdeI (YjbR/CyaY-like superfamily)
MYFCAKEMNNKAIMQKKEIETFCPISPQAWRKWLEENHQSKESIWLIYYKKKSNTPSLSWSEAVDEALCFGWIDSTAKSLDDDTYMQFFCKRKPNSVWSKVNKIKIKQLQDAALMAQAGLDSIEKAKQNGSWTILDDVEELIIPDDLEKAFESLSGSKDFFLSLSKSIRKAILQWLVLAKQQETRQKRINEIAERASQNLKPKQF